MLDVLQHPIASIGAIILVCFSARLISSTKKGQPMHPPGPKGYPVIGNLLEIGQRVTPWIAYSKLSRTYGDMVFLQSLGTKVLVLSSVEKAVDLLEKRSSKYSGRPFLQMLCGEMGFNKFFNNMDCGPLWRRQRRALHQELQSSVISQYHQPVISEEIHQYIRDMSSSPEDFHHHVQHYIDRLIFKCFYGVTIQDRDDPYVKCGVETMEGFITAGVPGTFAVDLFPALRYLPKWFPGTGWKDVANHYKEASELVSQAPYDHVLKLMSEGNGGSCMATRMIEKLPPQGSPARDEEEDVIRQALAVGFMGGSDTTAAAGMTFILLMALHPDVQRRAQMELDEVVGRGQIPSHADRDNLIYFQALVMEILRWHAEAPLGVPHKTTEDDVYHGYFIPKGTIVLANAWHMLKSTDNYMNPSEFNPERFIKDGQINGDVLDPRKVIFGFGRRICPGQQMGLDVLFSLLTATLAKFDISPPRDEAGHSTLKHSFRPGGIVVSPEPYECIITPRR